MLLYSLYIAFLIIHISFGKRESSNDNDILLCKDENCYDYDDYDSDRTTNEDKGEKYEWPRKSSRKILNATTDKTNIKVATAFKFDPVTASKALTTRKSDQTSKSFQDYFRVNTEKPLFNNFPAVRPIVEPSTVKPYAFQQPENKPPFFDDKPTYNDRKPAFSDNRNDFSAQNKPMDFYNKFNQQIINTDSSCTNDSCKDPCDGKDCGQTLFLTPLLESNDISTAVQLARVKDYPGLEAVKSYSGFFTVNKNANSSIFFWFVPAMNKERSSPLLIWLQGGIGVSSLFGFFVSHGPYELTSQLKVNQRNMTWVKTFNVLYIDNPIGTGFSFTKKNNDYPKNQEDVVEDLYSVIMQFYKLFPDYRDNHVYVCGNDYGAKFAVSLAFKIHSMGEESNVNLKGIVLESPLLDVDNIMEYGHFLYEFGFLDDDQLHEVGGLLQKGSYSIRRKQWPEAINSLEQLFNKDFALNQTVTDTYLPKLLGMEPLMHLTKTREPEDFSYYQKFINNPKVRKAIHVGNLKFQDGKMSYLNLREDIVQSVKTFLSPLLEHYRVLIYSGNLDMKTPYPLLADFLNNVRWKHANDFAKATRMIWKVSPRDNHIAGYVHHNKHFFEVMLRNAGHAVTYDQPRAALDMLTRFIWGRAFHLEE